MEHLRFDRLARRGNRQTASARIGRKQLIKVDSRAPGIGGAVYRVDLGEGTRHGNPCRRLKQVLGLAAG